MNRYQSTVAAGADIPPFENNMDSITMGGHHEERHHEPVQGHQSGWCYSDAGSGCTRAEENLKRWKEQSKVVIVHWLARPSSINRRSSFEANEVQPLVLTGARIDIGAGGSISATSPRHCVCSPARRTTSSPGAGVSRQGAGRHCRAPGHRRARAWSPHRSVQGLRHPGRGLAGIRALRSGPTVSAVAPREHEDLTHV